MKKSLKAFRDLTSQLSHTEMRTVKGGIDEAQCHQQSDLDCHNYTNANTPPGGTTSTGNTNEKGGKRNDLDD
ncbi:hypothetical protein BKI52_42920 [marine bacterium AO1-C]|nr:hypothetical protein BKI52_42920 [marine bacterium AO1-C]